MKESKEARFCRIAEARVNKIIKMVRLLGNCSGSNIYGYTSDQAEQIFSTLQIELDLARERFFRPSKSGKKRFSLSESFEPISDTLTSPHITLPITEGKQLRAVVYADESYPAINIYLLSDEKADPELLCFAEYNSMREPCAEVCIGAYRPDQEETTYYEPYMAERKSNDDDKKQKDI